MSDPDDATGPQRFERIENGQPVFARYRVENGTLALLHVEAHPLLRGTGAAGRLMEGILELARERDWRVDPVCGYAAAYIRRHPEHHDLLA